MRPRVTGLLVAALVLLAPARASANGQTICVDPAPSSGLTGCTETQPDVQAALDRAATYANLDTVKIEPGTFTAMAGQFSYDGGGGDNPVEIVGSGRGATRLVKTGTGAVLEVKSTTTSRVADLTVAPAAGTSMAPSAGIKSPNAFLTRVTVDPAGATGFVTGFDRR
jgi:hypothetical protein